MFIMEGNKMKRLAIGSLGVICLLGLFGAVVEAAEWDYHDWLTSFPDNADRVTVYGTIDCTIIGGPIGEGWLQHCEHLTGCVPAWCNDLIVKFEWAPNDSATCGNINYLKTAVVGGVPGDWNLISLQEWIDANVPPDGIMLPDIGDPSGEIQNVYVVVDLGVWLATPGILMSEYQVVDGLCWDLPGYLIGTTPIEYTPGAAEPFYTQPLTGWLQMNGDIKFTPFGLPSGSDQSRWGSIKALFR